MNSTINRRNPAKIKFFFYFIVAAVIVSVLTVIINNRFLSNNDALIASAKNRATLSLDKVDHTQIKAGIKEWRLKSGTVNYFQDRHEAIFTDLNIVMYSKDNDQTTLTARTGRLDTETNDIQVNGNVHVVNGEITLDTEKLNYTSTGRIISSDVPVKLSKGKSIMTADTMRMELNTNITTLNGHVKGTFFGNDQNK
jgi:LPS export ABC transporter protein LptC